ncbi:hypothetical protein [Verrucosispora sp. NA02020]|uniref:hypothetical protein n=1 Tax=Verrucosispora sp. NA02020 TaxID=2742132 RepID=UPI00159211CB|nr:hypothetical protein [Verrucosispora sp. NA02020]QKW15329.1 hypothetical protein HUT12_22920 [Verrucosispora sp. NA02020]
MSVNLVNGDTFTAITIHDTRGATLNIERTDDGRLSVWIAPPGGNDGPSVQLDEADVIAVVAYLSAGRPGALVPAAELAAEKANAKHWHDRYAGATASVLTLTQAFTDLAESQRAGAMPVKAVN